MDDPVVSHDLERGQELDREPADQGRREPDEAVGFDHFVKVDAKEFGHDTEMAAEIEVLIYLDQIVLILGVLQRYPGQSSVMRRA